MFYATIIIFLPRHFLYWGVGDTGEQRVGWVNTEGNSGPWWRDPHSIHQVLTFYLLLQDDELILTQWPLYFHLWNSYKVKRLFKGNVFQKRVFFWFTLIQKQSFFDFTNILNRQYLKKSSSSNDKLNKHWREINKQFNYKNNDLKLKGYVLCLLLRIFRYFPLKLKNYLILTGVGLTVIQGFRDKYLSVHNYLCSHTCTNSTLSLHHLWA